MKGPLSPVQSTPQRIITSEVHVGDSSIVTQARQRTPLHHQQSTPSRTATPAKSTTTRTRRGSPQTTTTPDKSDSPILYSTPSSSMTLSLSTSGSRKRAITPHTFDSGNNTPCHSMACCTMAPNSCCQAPPRTTPRTEPRRQKGVTPPSSSSSSTSSSYYKNEWIMGGMALLGSMTLVWLSLLLYMIQWEGTTLSLLPARSRNASISLQQPASMEAVLFQEEQRRRQQALSSGGGEGGSLLRRRAQPSNQSINEHQYQQQPVDDIQKTATKQKAANQQQQHHNVEEDDKEEEEYDWLVGTSSSNSDSRDSSSLDQTNHDEEVAVAVVGEKATVEEEVVHIIHTRFMQLQPTLFDLGMARLRLFQAFFLASLEMQTSQNFIVVVRTDPNLNATLLEHLQDTLQSSKLPHYVLLGDNDVPDSQHASLMTNPQLFGHDGDGIAAAKNSNSTLLLAKSGDWQVMQDYLLQSNHILETRLDVDDGLSKFFVGSIQREASQSFFPFVIPRDCDQWRFWCAGQHLEWQFQPPWEEEKNEKEDVMSSGGLVSLQFSGCVTAGLTVGFVKDATAATNSHHHKKKCGGGYPAYPIIKHQQLHGAVPDCRDAPSHHKSPLHSQCLSFSKLTPSALRGRTPTSAGMLNILWNGGEGSHHNNTTDPNSAATPEATNLPKAKLPPLTDMTKKYVRGAKKQVSAQETLWWATENIFGFSMEHGQELHSYIADHLQVIALDNLRGQCTYGHSCKNTSQALLQSIIDSTTMKTSSST